VHNLKYKGIKEIGFELGKIYGSVLYDSGFTSGIDLIIPVPLHPSKKRQRGFNQSDIISAGLSYAAGLPVDVKILERKVSTGTQTRKSRYERWANVEGTFNVTDPQSLEGRHILLVDDVITTGSTIESCVNELLKIDGVKVSVVTLAVAVM
jgi:ComF family protein